MQKDFERTVFYRAFMTCVFAGLVGTIISMMYNLFFTQVLKYPLSSIVNVSTLIFAVNILFLVMGFVFYGFIKAARRGETMYIILCTVLTLFFIWRLQSVQRTNDAHINVLFRYLSSGITLVLGLLAAAGVPWLFHNKRFAETVL